MKKLVILTIAVSASAAFVGCSDDKPVRVVHETTVVHHRSGENVGSAQNGTAEDFQPVERPATYSH